MVYYTLPNEEYFSSSIPNGMLTTRPVTFLPMKNARTTVYRSGMKITPAEDGVYGQPGNYRINLLVLAGRAAKMETAACTRSIFIFPLFRRCRPRSAF